MPTRSPRVRPLTLALCAATGFALASVAALAAWNPQEEQQAAAASPPSITDALKALSADEAIYHQHNVTLSNPWFEGRAPGLRGNELAAEYVEFYLKRAGLKPVFDEKTGGVGASEGKKSYRQEFRKGGSESVLMAQVLAFTPKGGEAVNLEPGRDFNTLGMSGSGKVEGDLVFVGYGIDDGPNGYSSYPEGTELKGKVAMVLRFEPKDDKGRSKWANAERWTSSAGLGPKLDGAIRRGAAGIILVNPPGADDPRVGTIEDFSLKGMGKSVPVMMATIERANALLAASSEPRTLDALTEAADDAGGVTPIPGVTVSMESTVERRPIKTWNVAGVLPGRGALADQYVIVGGHYDHVGYGAFGSRHPQPSGKLHPGADDNASGTSGVLLAAAKISEMYKKLPEGTEARSVIFMGFSAEESGLEGSRWFVRNSPVPAKSVQIMINMDMIGRLRQDKFDCGGAGSAEGLADIVDPIFARSGLKIRTRDSEGKGFNGRGPSDHASFYSSQVPVLFFFTGLHPEYHMPSDVYTTINTPGAVRVVNAAIDVAYTLALKPEQLVFTGDGRTLQPDFTQTREEGPRAANPGAGPGAPAGQGDQPAPGGRMGPVRVRFGIAPGDYSDDKPGVLVGDVYPGTSAADAGIKVGDRMVKWDGKEVKDVQGWMPLLAGQKPGDVVKITLVRDGKEVEVECKLKGRESSDR